MKTIKIVDLTETEIANENIIRIIDSCQFVNVPAGESRFITFSGSRNATINTNCGEYDTYEVEYFNACKLSFDRYHYYGMKLKNVATDEEYFTGSSKLFLPFDAKIVGFEIKNNSSNAIKVNVDFRSI